MRGAGGLLAAALLVLGCRAPEPAAPAPTLSSYGLFAGEMAEQRPAAGVVPYDINTPLFSDYAAKLRFVRLPPGTAAGYRPSGPFDFPVGTVLVKTFAYPADLRRPGIDLRLLETRLLIHEAEGWVGLPYIWNEEQSEAHLELTGGRLEVSWTHLDGELREHRYLIPNANQCKGCHRTSGRRMAPIGPQAGQLNRELDYPEGVENQLAHWTRIGALSGAPEPAAAPRLAVWDRPETGTLDERARAWLDSNCAHCHNPEGPARTSGLDLGHVQADPTKLGVYKYPVAAGRGSGDHLFGIYPGRPEASILVLRLRSLDPAVMMPELGRGLVHRESVALIEEWIAAMPDPRPARRPPSQPQHLETPRPKRMG